MKPKIISKVISSKFDEWVKNISDSKVQKLVRDNSIITGGCIASMLLKEKVNDYDIYFTNKETVLAVAEYYTRQWNIEHGDDGYVLDGAKMDEYLKNFDERAMPGGAGMNMTPDRVKIIFKSRGIAGDVPSDEEIDEADKVASDKIDETKPKYRPVFMSCNAITLSNQIQIVIRFYGDPDNIHQHYDYMHCTNYWISKHPETNAPKLVLKQEALECLLTRELKYVGSKYPIASIVRMRKFIKRGWTVNAGQVLKICYQISKLDLDDVAVLEDQLTGVDVAYFVQLVNALAEHKKKNPDFVLDYSYLAEIIDRIF